MKPTLVWWDINFSGVLFIAYALPIIALVEYGYDGHPAEAALVAVGWFGAGLIVMVLGILSLRALDRDHPRDGGEAFFYLLCWPIALLHLAGVGFNAFVERLLD